MVLTDNELGMIEQLFTSIKMSQRPQACRLAVLKMDKNMSIEEILACFDEKR